MIKGKKLFRYVDMDYLNIRDKDDKLVCMLEILKKEDGTVIIEGYEPPPEDEK